jgi:putative membrane protein
MQSDLTQSTGTQPTSSQAVTAATPKPAAAATPHVVHAELAGVEDAAHGGFTHDARFIQRTRWTEYIGITGRGLLMGAADVVPGVSGGTIAFITGIYSELIYSLKMIGSRQFWSAAARLRIGEAWRAANLTFLFTLLLGIGVAVVTLAPGIEYMLHNQPTLIWSFFFGLVAASVITMLDSVSKWTVALVLAVVAGAVFAWWLVGLVPVVTPRDPWFLVLAGALAICAMILPGISGSFILLLLGQYQYILGSLNDRVIAPIIWVGIGAVVGLITFAQLLNWLFKRYHDATVAVLIGFMIGSLRKVWPWKEYYEGVQGTAERNILPALQLDGAVNTEIFLAIGAALIGVAAVLIVERVARAQNK